MKPILFVLAFIALAGCAKDSDSQSANELTREAQTMLRDTGRGEYNPEAMKLLDRAVSLDPDYVAARQERLNQYLAKGDLSAAIDESGEVVRIKDIPETRLYHCMLREVKSPGFTGQDSCYLGVAEAIADEAERPYTNLNYVLALRLSDSPEFTAQAEQHLDSLKHEDVKALTVSLLFNKSREQLIKTYVPVQ